MAGFGRLRRSLSAGAISPSAKSESRLMVARAFIPPRPTAAAAGRRVAALLALGVRLTDGVDDELDVFRAVGHEDLLCIGREVRTRACANLILRSYSRCPGRAHPVRAESARNDCPS